MGDHEADQGVRLVDPQEAPASSDARYGLLVSMRNA